MKPKKRVLHCLGWVISGGVEQRRKLLAEGLCPEAYEHLVICQEADGVIPPALEKAGWQIVEIGMARHILDPSWHRKAIAIARRFRPDIVHGAVIEGVALATSVGLALPRAKVIAEETSDPVDRRWTGNALMRAMCLRADVAVGVSPAVTGYLRDIARVPKRKIRLIPNAVMNAPSPPESVIQHLRADFALQPHHRVIGSVGRIFDSHKRFSDLIRALPRIRENVAEARLLIVGDGPDRPRLESLASELGLREAVLFVGYQGDPRPFYELMDVFALASAHEAFGLVLVEAMFARVSVVATAVGGIPFVLDDGRCGRLVPPFDPEALAGAITALLQDDGERRRLAEAGHARARADFSADRYCRDIDRLYRQLTAAG